MLLQHRRVDRPFATGGPQLPSQKPLADAEHILGMSVRSRIQ